LIAGIGFAGPWLIQSQNDQTAPAIAAGFSFGSHPPEPLGSAAVHQKKTPALLERELIIYL